MSRAEIRWISGPVLRGRASGPFSLREAIRVGPRELLGEVIRIEADEIAAQVYEDTTGLKPGDQITGTGAPLGIRLGPGLLGGIFDGLLRPLSGWTTPYVDAGAGGHGRGRFHFAPALAAGETLAAGVAFGEATDGLGRVTRCLAPPELSGRVDSIAPPGEYADDEAVAVLIDAGGRRHTLAMSHFWPVRVPRPARRRLPAAEPLVTGQRILDALFPVALGGKAAIPGGFGTGKTVLLEALAKGCNADVIIYLGCGERGNEMAGALEEFSELTDPRTGRPLAERTVIIANTSNMPVAAREASIYSGVTVAEYFRDQGLHVALMADSTSRWAEALREVASRFGEMPGESGYPPYLGSRLAEFYERAGRFETLAGTVGSVTLLGSVSPQSGDFSEPVTSHTMRYVRCFWALDPLRAQARFYPAINPLRSYSEDAMTLTSWWDEVFADLPAGAPLYEAGESEWLTLRRRALTLLDEQARLERMARIIGKDALQPRQRLALACAELFGEAFLRQSAFSPTDRHASPRRQAWMMRLLARFVAAAEQALARGATPERIAELPIVRALARMGEELGEGRLADLAALAARMESELAGLTAEAGSAP